MGSSDLAICAFTLLLSTYRLRYPLIILWPLLIYINRTKVYIVFDFSALILAYALL